MSDFENDFSRILGDPNAMREIMDMAAAFRNGGSEEKSETEERSGIDPEMLSRIMRIAGELGRDGEDASLLYAIRPYLNPRRKAKFNDALSVMRMARLIPCIRKEGLL